MQQSRNLTLQRRQSKQTNVIGHKKLALKDTVLSLFSRKSIEKILNKLRVSSNTHAAKRAKTYRIISGAVELMKQDKKGSLIT